MDHGHAPADGHAHGHDAGSHASGSHDGGHAHHGGMSNATVFLILLVVTVAEVGVAYLEIAKWLKVLTFVAMALYKAVMVAYHFMHLKFEKRIMWLVASAPLFLGVLITIGTYPDSEKGTDHFKKGDLRRGAAAPAATPGHSAPESHEPPAKH